MSASDTTEHELRKARAEADLAEAEVDRARAEAEKLRAEALTTHHGRTLSSILRQNSPTLMVAILGLTGSAVTGIYSYARYQSDAARAEQEFRASRAQWELDFAAKQLEGALKNLPDEAQIRTRIQFLDAYQFADADVERAVSTGLDEIDEEIAAATLLIEARARVASTSAQKVQVADAAYRATENLHAAQELLDVAAHPEDHEIKRVMTQVELRPDPEGGGALVGTVRQPTERGPVPLDAPGDWFVRNRTEVRKVRCGPPGAPTDVPVDQVLVDQQSAAVTELRLEADFDRCLAHAEVIWELDLSSPPEGLPLPARWKTVKEGAGAGE